MLCRSMSLTDDMGIVKEISDYFGTDIGEGNDFETQIVSFQKLKKNLSKKTQDFLNSKPKYVKFLLKEHRNLTCEEILFRYALKINGQVDKTGKHASGIAVSAEPFKDFAPLKKVRGEILLGLQEGGHAKEVSAFGLLKFDWLGLINVSKNMKMFDNLQHYYKIDGNELYRQIIYKDDYNDPEVIKVFDNYDTIGVFQFGSDGIRNCLKQAEIKSFNDVCIINAMYRPGAINQFDDLVNRMRNPETIAYEHPDLEKALKSTYGLVIYQEQTMQMMQIVGGFTLNEADRARAILKKLTRNKNPDKHSVEYYEYQQMMSKFRKGAKKKGFDDKQTEKFVQFLADAQGYCLHKDTIIKGCNKKIIDVEIGDEVETYDTNKNKIVKSKIVQKYKNEKKKLYKIKTESGKELICSFEHKIMCEDKIMRSLKDILKGKYKILVED